MMEWKKVFTTDYLEQHTLIVGACLNVTIVMPKPIYEHIGVNTFLLKSNFGLTGDLDTKDLDSAKTQAIAAAKTYLKGLSETL